MFYAASKQRLPCVISACTARRMLRGGCVGCLTSVTVDSSTPRPQIDEVEVVRDFQMCSRRILRGYPGYRGGVWD